MSYARRSGSAPRSVGVALVAALVAIGCSTRPDVAGPIAAAPTAVPLVATPGSTPASAETESVPVVATATELPLVATPTFTPAPAQPEPSPTVPRFGPLSAGNADLDLVPMPADHSAHALTIAPVRAMGGWVRAGDHVSLHGVRTDGSVDHLDRVEVLGVDLGAVPEHMTIVLALEASEVATAAELVANTELILSDPPSDADGHYLVAIELPGARFIEDPFTIGELVALETGAEGAAGGAHPVFSMATDDYEGTGDGTYVITLAVPADDIAAVAAAGVDPSVRAIPETASGDVDEPPRATVQPSDLLGDDFIPSPPAGHGAYTLTISGRRAVIDGVPDVFALIAVSGEGSARVLDPVEFLAWVTTTDHRPAIALALTPDEVLVVEDAIASGDLVLVEPRPRSDGYAIPVEIPARAFVQRPIEVGDEVFVGALGPFPVEAVIAGRVHGLVVTVPADEVGDVVRLAVDPATEVSRS